MRYEFFLELLVRRLCRGFRAFISIILTYYTKDTESCPCHDGMATLEVSHSLSVAIFLPSVVMSDSP
jgi:hypothetical protein